MVVVVLVGVEGVVVVVVVVLVGVEVGVDVFTAPGVGTEEPVPTAVRVAVGGALGAGFAMAAIAFTVTVGACAGATCVAPPGEFTPASCPAAGPTGAVAAGLGGVVVDAAAGAGAPECEESADWTRGPEPMLSPATTDRAAAAAAPDATMRLRTKYSLGPTTAAGATARGVFGIGWPNARDVKTSSKVATSSAAAPSGFDPLMTLHSIVRSGWALDTRSPGSEIQTPPRIQGYSDEAHVNTEKQGICLELSVNGSVH